MKLYNPKRMSTSRGSLKGAKLSSHLVKPAKFASSKVSVKPVRMGTGKLGGQHKTYKVKI